MSALRKLLPPKPGVKWGDFGFGLNLANESKMVSLQTAANWNNAEMKVLPYAPISLEPSATILNYGQGLFEGIKAHRTVKDRIVVFRGDRNGARLANGAIKERWDSGVNHLATSFIRSTNLQYL